MFSKYYGNRRRHAGYTVGDRALSSYTVLYSPIQSSTQTHMDLRNSAMGAGSNSNIEILCRFQSKTLLSNLNAPSYISNHRIQEDLQMNTVLSEIEKWNTRYLRKLENHTNALVVNLLDNSETTHRLKRYTVLTLPDRPE
jgi:hypothetical protein